MRLWAASQTMSLTRHESIVPKTLSNGSLRVVLREVEHDGTRQYFLDTIELESGGKRRLLARGCEGAEFATSLGDVNATTCERVSISTGEQAWRLSARTEYWDAEEVISLAPEEPVLRRSQTYRFHKTCAAALHPGFRIKAVDGIRYTFPLRAHEQPLAGLEPIRSAVDWALPFPFHVWHDGTCVALYGVDRSSSVGTLDFMPVADEYATLRVYYPDSDPQAALKPPSCPDVTKFDAGAEVTITEVFAVKPLAVGDEPLLETERMAAMILLRTRSHRADLKAVAAGIVDFYKHCELWEPNALGKGRGWFRNMWVRTQTGPAKKQGEMSGYFDLGWGEGIAVEMWMGAVRHWKRTGDRSLLPYVDEMTQNIDFFKRGNKTDAPYYDRTDGTKRGDFLMDVTPGSRIWTHSLGHTGSQLIQLYQLAPDYPNSDTRKQWLATATSIGSFLAKHQKPDGDLQDIFDDDNRELNRKPHRITARAVVCGLWTRLGQVTGDKAWIGRASRLAKAVSPEILRYEYYNQMLDGIHNPDKEFVDGEAAYYVLEGLVPLYVETRDDGILALCKKAAAFGFAWTYFYDLPKANRGVARGGQCCRMDDYPLLYPIGPAKAMEPLLALAQATGDSFFEKMAEEMAIFIGNWQIDDPGKPWHGGMIHALGQYCGKHWGPDLAGQVDSGMATGNSLAAIEAFIAHSASRA